MTSLVLLAQTQIPTTSRADRASAMSTTEVAVWAVVIGGLVITSVALFFSARTKLGDRNAAWQAVVLPVAAIFLLGVILIGRIFGQNWREWGIISLLFPMVVWGWIAMVRQFRRRRQAGATLLELTTVEHRGAKTAAVIISLFLVAWWGWSGVASASTSIRQSLAYWLLALNFANVGLFSWLSSGAHQITEHGIQANVFVRWDEIASYGWTNDAVLRIRRQTMSVLAGRTLRLPIPNQAERQEVDRLLKQHLGNDKEK